MNSSLKIKLSFLIIALFAIASCKPDDNKDVDQRDKFIGSWNCTETSSKNHNSITFSVAISKNELTTNEIYLSNFYLLGSDQKARSTVDYSNLSIPQQVVCNLNVHGSGAYTQSKVNLLYYVNDNADIDTVNAILSK